MSVVNDTNDAVIANVASEDVSNKMRIALVGNPNSGKTTLFNELTGARQKVGNWPGVTVDRKEGHYRENSDIEVIDLPGTYSLEPFSPEERITHDFLEGKHADVVIDVVDATNIERNLLLATQVLESGMPVVIALNMMDIAKTSGISIDETALAAELRCPVVKISAISGEGVTELMDAAEQAASASNCRVANSQTLTGSRESADVQASACAQCSGCTTCAERFARIEQLCDSYVVNSAESSRSAARMKKLDLILTNRFSGIAVFVLVMFFIYWLAVSVGGGFVTDWANESVAGAGWTYGGEVVLDEAGEEAIEGGVFVPSLGAVVGEWLELTDAPGWLSSLLVDGVIGGVGAVIGFVPQLAILFALLGILEGCGYMARVAFVMDRILRRFGLSGKSFISFLIASGCGVPAIMSTKTIEDERERRLTIMTATMIPCGAKLPIIALVFGALAGADYTSTWWVAPAFYFMAMIVIVASCIILRKSSHFKGQVAPFIMELPRYHIPKTSGVLLSVWHRVRAYIVQAGTIIFASTIVIWFLMSFGMQDGAFGLLDSEAPDYIENSLLASLGSLVAWIFAPLGFGTWEASVTTITGLVAKENVVATVGVITHLSEVGEFEPSLWEGFMFMFGGSAAAVAAFCAFNLLCAPCFAAIGAIRTQMASAKWTWAAILYMCANAWCVALMIYQFVGLLTDEIAFGPWSIAAICVAALGVFLLARPTRSEQRAIPAKVTA